MSSQRAGGCSTSSTGPSGGTRRWASAPPFFVVTHEPPREVRLARELGLRFTFAGALVSAIEQARAAATGGDVVIMGGGDVRLVYERAGDA
ncbi:hypothetical protein FAF44_21630 [Nonomuraea sp. MG754425]|uniref:hypothetical protein n=1 Tax=Nonomuraea sp. MG754425 TaxID=2570319 RepID=UPI001F282F57|nr:hypothetical protein [Nonomuraea sp. MG754425]MCF6470978.1 hypothetical protein [Nonomuraea sp. MG754425]